MSGNLINISFLIFIIASFIYIVNVFINRKEVNKALGYAGTFSMILGLLVISAAILIRWEEAQRPPFSNMYESLILFAWSIAIIYLVLEAVYKFRAAGAISAILAVVSIAAASFFDDTITALVPALQSNWLLYHVLTCFIGYAAFAVSAAGSVVLLYHVLKHVYGIRMKAITIFASIVSVIVCVIVYFYRDRMVPGHGQAGDNKLEYWLPFILGYMAFMGSMMVGIVYQMLKNRGKRPQEEKKAEVTSDFIQVLQSFNYEAIRFGFLLLAVGIITGAVWANEAWGTYWSWDVKETWSLITWIVYAILIHFKYVSGRFGFKDLRTFNAICSILGFHAVIFTYFGVNFLLSGLHSYA